MFHLITIFLCICFSFQINCSHIVTEEEVPHAGVRLYNQVRLGHQEKALEMLQNDELVQRIPSQYLENILLDSCKYGYKKIVDALLQKGVNPNIIQRKMLDDEEVISFPLLTAVAFGQSDIVKLLVNYKDKHGNRVVDVNVSGENNVTSLMIAMESFNKFRQDDNSSIAKKYKKIINYLLEVPNINVNQTMSTGATLLIFAIECKCIDVVKLLINHRDKDGKLDLDVNARSNINIIIDNSNEILVNNMTPLLFAVFEGFTEAVALLLQVDGIDVNATDVFGHTALTSASAQGNEEIVTMLLNVDTIDTNKGNPLYLASLHGHHKVVNKLVNHKNKFDQFTVNLEASNNQGQSPLLVACALGYSLVVPILLQTNRVNINKTDRSGTSPLFVAVMKNHKDIVKMLLAKDTVNVNLANIYGITPLMMTVAAKNVDIVTMLINSEQPIHYLLQNSEGKIAYDIGMDYDSKECLLVLQPYYALKTQRQLLHINDQEKEFIHAYEKFCRKKPQELYQLLFGRKSSIDTTGSLLKNVTQTLLTIFKKNHIRSVLFKLSKNHEDRSFTEMIMNQIALLDQNKIDQIILKINQGEVDRILSDKPNCMVCYDSFVSGNNGKEKGIYPVNWYMCTQCQKLYCDTCAEVIKDKFDGACANCRKKDTIASYWKK
ncbi:MAG: hypothetical protein CL947_02705 [Epsilonproteobacteria bacterium]|nr:hypothetical protein [Campylobacterota bacterium]